MKHIKIQGLVALVLTIAMMAAAVFGGSFFQRIADSAPVEGIEAAGAASGVYTGTSKGFGGDVTATVTVKNNTISDIQLEGASETPTLGGKAIEELAAAMFAADKLDVDGVAGATITSNAIKQAIADALAQAGYTAEFTFPEEAAPEAVPATTETAEFKADGAADGTYTGTAQGFGGEVKATITVAGGLVTDIKLEGADETPALGGKALETLPAAMLAAGTAEVDAVAGATISSGAAKEAVAAALAAAGVQ